MAEPDLPGITEVRVHGVGGTRPAALLGVPEPRQVSGDAIAGFYRRGDVAGRHVEAYSWGGLTSRSGTRILWLLLLPFMLANLAGWMVPAGLAARRGWFRAYRVVMRWAGLAVTLDFVLLLTWICVDYLGYQCGARPACTQSWPAFLASAPEHPARRILLAALVPLAAIALLAALAHRSVRRYERVRPPVAAGAEHEPERSGAALPEGPAHRDFWAGERSAWRLGSAHVAAALALLAVLVAHTAHAAQAGAGVRREWLATAAMALGGAVLLGALLLPLLERHRRPERPGGRAHRPGPLELGLLAVSAIPVTLAAIFAWSQAAHPGPVAGELPGMATAVTAACAATLAAILLVPLLLGAEAITRRGHAAEPGRFRWCAPFVTLALGVWALNTVMLGTLIQVAGMTGRIAYAERLPAGGAATVAVFPGVRHAATFLIVLPALVLALFGCHQLAMYLRARFGREREQVREHYRRLERERPGDVWLASAVAGPGSPGWLGVRGWPGRVAGARRLARATLELDRPATGMVAGLLCLWPVLGDRLPEGAIGAGTAAAALLPVLLLGLLRSGWRDLDRRRTVGVLWDVGTFWPRSYHPLAPPSYAERAVPDLQRRMWRLHDAGGRVVITAHSQGSVLAAAALMQRECRPPDDVVALVTFGSPLRKLYHWAFPAYFNSETLGRLRELRVARWENLYYLTDWVGGPVRAASCRDVELDDPRTSLFRYGDPPPRIAGHSGYWQDPALWAAVSRAATVLRRTLRAPAAGEERARTAPAVPESA